MRVLLISANTETIYMVIPPVGLACVAAATRQAGHEVRVLDLLATPDAANTIRHAVGDFRPEVIGVSIRNIDDQNMKEPRFLLEEAKEAVSCCRNISDAPVVLGGAGFSIFPESSLQYLGAHMGIQGEGEEAFPLLLARMERKADLSVPGLYLPGKGIQAERAFIQELDQYPLPDPSSMPLPNDGREEIWLPLQTRRGCPLSCNYCSTALVEGCQIRRRSHKAVVKALSTWASAGFPKIYFVDNIFNLPSAYAETLCREIADAYLGISWRCILYPGKINASLVRAMAKAGCKEVSLGFESGSENILHVMNKRFHPGEIRQASRLLADYGIQQMGFLLLGGPGETKETVEESLSFADSLPINALKLTIGIRIYPYTSLAATALQEGLISPDDNLLFPTFYMVKDLEPWLRETADAWVAERPNWMY
jgi:radical SAM superfamily enzyme YgiQ (UPF0313 family)